MDGWKLVQVRKKMMKALVVVQHTQLSYSLLKSSDFFCDESIVKAEGPGPHLVHKHAGRSSDDRTALS